MSLGEVFQGGLFAGDLLTEAIAGSADRLALDGAELDGLEVSFRALFGHFFRWDEERRLRLRAKVDAMFFHLCGVTDRDDVRYAYSTFPFAERREAEAYGRYRSRDLCLAYLNALAVGRPDVEPSV